MPVSFVSFLDGDMTVLAGTDEHHASKLLIIIFFFWQTCTVLYCECSVMSINGSDGNGLDDGQF